jgi:tetratricopeptide (TPR) repeat protein
LAGTLFAQKKFGEAETIYQQLIEQRQSTGAVLNPSSALILQHLGEIRLSHQDNDGAQEYFKSALEIHEKNDQSSLAAAELMEKYAFLLEQTGRTEESRKMKDRAQDAKRLRT